MSFLKNFDRALSFRRVAKVILISFFCLLSVAPHAKADDIGTEKKIRKLPSGVSSGSAGGGLKELGDPLNGSVPDKKKKEVEKTDRAQNPASRLPGKGKKKTSATDLADVRARALRGRADSTTD